MLEWLENWYRAIVLSTALLALVVGIIRCVPTVLQWLTSRKKPIIIFEQRGNGSLYRWLGEMYNKYWGVILLYGKVRVKHKIITIVNAQLSMDLEEPHYFERSLKYIDASFPPTYFFGRLTDGGEESIAFSREDFTPVTLRPGEGEQDRVFKFGMMGNFAEEYGKSMFNLEFCPDSLHNMFVPMYIRLQYEYNGDLYWTDKFFVIVAPFDNKGYLGQLKTSYINEDGTVVGNIIYKTCGRQ